MGKFAFNARGRLVLAGFMVALAAYAPALVAATTTRQVTPVADAWVSVARSVRNFGTTSVLRVQAGAYEAYLRFQLTPWVGQPADGLELVLSGMAGDASSLLVVQVGGGWRETGLTYASRPAQVGTTSLRGTPAADGLHLPLGAFFDSGTIDRDSISLRVTSMAATLVLFSSREGAAPPMLVLSAPPPRLVGAAADSYITPVKPDAGYGAKAQLAVDADPQAEAYIDFDVSPWLGRRPARVELSLTLRDAAGGGATVSRVAGGWSESTLTWNSRPAAGHAVGSAGGMGAGPVLIDLSRAYPTGIVDSTHLLLRIATANADGFLFSSREGAAPPALVFTSRASASGPTATPSPTPTRSPSPTPTRSPSPTPTRSPSPTPTRSPSPTPSPTAAPTATPLPTPIPPTAVFHFRGQGSDHGVGMSQYGARGRAAAGQTYDQILGHYYTGTTLGSVDPSLLVRVSLNSGYVPNAGAPARITARLGGWTSSAFVDEVGAPVVFAADSYVQLAPSDAGWQATAYDSTGAVLSSVAATDLNINPADPATRLEMTWRSSLTRYTLYRGAIRLLVAGVSVQAINIVTLDDYVRGVVPAEMPPLWPIEAVKAQAVAARGYAYLHLHPDRPWDVVPTSDNQVYGGASLEHPRSNLAVDATAGQLVLYHGAPANTFFFTVAGGYTENNEYAWPGRSGKVVANPIAYLRGVSDYDANGLAYDSGAPGFAWQSSSFTWAQLSTMLAADARTNIGTLTDISFARGVSGRAYCVTIVGTTRTVSVSGAVFKGIFNAHNASVADLRSTMYYLEPE